MATNHDSHAEAPGALASSSRHRPTRDTLGSARASDQDGDATPFRAILEQSPLALYTTDADGRITFFNAAAAALWGRHPRIGQDRWCGSWRLYGSDASPMPHEECPLAIMLRTGRSIQGVEAVAERPDGSRVAFLSNPSPLFDDAGELVGAVNVLVQGAGGGQAEEAVQRLAAIVASSDDAIISKTLNGIITSWNEAAERLFGYSADEIIGQSILTLIPVDRRSEENEIIDRIRAGERIKHYETVRRRKDGSLVHISLSVSPIKRDDGTIIGASKIARDISERRRTQTLLTQRAHQLATLDRVSREISRDLDLDRIVQAVTDIGTELSGARFGAFFYNLIDETGESYLLYTLSGAPRSAFENFGMPRNTAVFRPTFEGTEIVRSDDIRRDPRYGHNPPHRGMPEGHLPVVSYLAVPVVSSSGEVLGGLFFGHDEPGIFGPDTETLISAIAGQAAVAMDNARLHKAAQLEIEQRRRAEDAKELLLHEIKHRVKNTLATIQAMASQTFRRAPPEESEAFVARLHALSGAHDLLTQQSWEAVDVGNVIRRALSPFLARGEDRAAMSGPDAMVDSSKALLLAMALHELGTNAVKYGAWSNHVGTVEVRWDLVDDGDDGMAFTLVWREEGGPPTTQPDHKGFGSRMIERALRGERGGAYFEFAASGLVCTLRFLL